MTKHFLRSKTAFTVLAFAFPLVALADLSSTVTLQSGTALSLDTGATSSSGGDILFAGTMAPQGNATVFIDGPLGATVYNGLTLQVIMSTSGYSKNPIPSGGLPVGEVFSVHTNGGNYAKVLVTGVATGSISLQYTTYGAAATGGTGSAGAPTVTSIQNNSSLVPSGFPNYGIAPSSLFVIKGTGMADPNSPNPPSLQSSAAPGIPTTLYNASISVTVNNVTTHPGIYYAIPTQIAAVLPAATPVGTGTLTVTNNGVPSTPVPIQVVTSALGINNYNGGLGAVTDVNGNVFTFTRSASFGQTAVMWATGLGADPADSDTVYTTSPNRVNVPLQVYVGGVLATIPYQGGSVYPGVNQINITIPSTAPTGCYVPIVAVIGSVVSNTVTIPIAPSGGVCSDALYGLTGNQISTLSGQSTVKSGTLIVAQSNAVSLSGTPTVTGAAEGIFQQVTGANYISTGAVSVGGCLLTQVATSTTTPTSIGLDAGTITVTAPGGSPLTLTSTPIVPGLYIAQLAAGFIPTSGGTFSFNGSGGSQVGSFSTTVNFPNPLITWTNESAAATITRGSGLSVTWSGGAGSSYVLISGSSSNTTVSGSYTCIAPVAAGQFTVPSYVLLGLPAGTGSTIIENTTAFSSFSATGLDYGTAFGAVIVSAKSTFN